MTRAEFIAGFTRARERFYKDAIKSGRMRPSESAMGLADARAEAIKSWRTTPKKIRELPHWHVWPK